ncbi:hypothetical protein D3C79_875420 [compost metagenome]
MSVPWRIQEAGKRHRHGDGDHLCHDAGLRQRLGDQHLYSGSAGSGVPAHAVIHSGDRRCGAIYRDGSAQNQPGAVSPAGDLPAADHHQLRGARRGAA